MKVLDANGALKITSSDVVVPWTDYSAISTIVGWSSFTTKEILYERDGDKVHCAVTLIGPSDDTVATFTLPYTANMGFTLRVPILAGDNSGAEVAGILIISDGSATFACGSTTAGAGWTASGTKTVRAEFWYRTTQPV